MTASASKLSCPHAHLYLYFGHLLSLAAYLFIYLPYSSWQRGPDPRLDDSEALSSIRWIGEHDRRPMRHKRCLRAGEQKSVRQLRYLYHPG